jgi:hypothetical protein
MQGVLLQGAGRPPRTPPKLWASWAVGRACWSMLLFCYK